jgi:hypothetical protein
MSYGKKSLQISRWDNVAYINLQIQNTVATKKEGLN